MITKEKIIQILIDHFLDDLENDPTGLGDWLAQSDEDIDEVIKQIKSMKNECKTN